MDLILLYLIIFLRYLKEIKKFFNLKKVKKLTFKSNLVKLKVINFLTFFLIFNVLINYYPTPYIRNIYKKMDTV